MLRAKVSTATVNDLTGRFKKGLAGSINKMSGTSTIDSKIYQFSSSRRPHSAKRRPDNYGWRTC